MLQLEGRYDEARMQLISGFFESYIPIDYKEDIQLLNDQERVRFMEFVPSWVRTGYEEGIEEGVKERPFDRGYFGCNWAKYRKK